jgi:hypothetical protein
MYYILNIEQDGKDLRYCIESIKKWNPKADITVVGTIPEWYKGDALPLERKNNKSADTAYKIMEVAKHANGDFVLVSDDHFFNSKESTEVQYASGLLTEASSEQYPSVLASLVKRDGHQLKNMGYDDVNYGSHAPLHTCTKDVINAAKVFPLHRVAAKAAIVNIAGGAKYKDIDEPKLREAKTYAELKKLPFFSLNPLFDVYSELDKILSEPIKKDAAPKKKKAAPKKKAK